MDRSATAFFLDYRWTQRTKCCETTCIQALARRLKSSESEQCVTTVSPDPRGNPVLWRPLRIRWGRYTDLLERRVCPPPQPTSNLTAMGNQPTTAQLEQSKSSCKITCRLSTSWDRGSAAVWLSLWTDYFSPPAFTDRMPVSLLFPRQLFPRRRSPSPPAQTCF